MPYVTGSGQIVDSEPWSLSYIIKAVGEAFGVVSLFLTTMLPFDLFGSRRQSGNRNTPNRPSSNIRTSRRLAMYELTMKDSNFPTMYIKQLSNCAKVFQHCNLWTKSPCSMDSSRHQVTAHQCIHLNLIAYL